MPNIGPFEVIVTIIGFGVTILGIGIFILICYALIVFVARLLHRVLPATTPPRDPAMDDLRSRFARGEIDEAEYKHLRSVLQGS